MIESSVENTVCKGNLKAGLFSYFRVSLVRRTLPGVFSFEYELPTPYNATETPQSLDLENELPSVLQFEIGSSDIGGTLAVELQLDHNKVSWITRPFQYKIELFDRDPILFEVEISVDSFVMLF